MMAIGQVELWGSHVTVALWLSTWSKLREPREAGLVQPISWRRSLRTLPVSSRSRKAPVDDASGSGDCQAQ